MEKKTVRQWMLQHCPQGTKTAEKFWANYGSSLPSLPHSLPSFIMWNGWEVLLLLTLVFFPLSLQFRLFFPSVCPSISLSLSVLLYLFHDSCLFFYISSMILVFPSISLSLSVLLHLCNLRHRRSPFISGEQYKMFRKKSDLI